jgi:hypothetical protein
MRISPQLCCPILTLLEADNSILFGKKIKRFVAAALRHNFFIEVRAANLWFKLREEVEEEKNKW